MDDRSMAIIPGLRGPGPAITKAGPRSARLLLQFAAVAILALVSTVHVQAGPFEDAQAAQAKGDHGAAARIYRSLADQGNVAALTQLGILYRLGRGVPKDLDEAMDMLRRAASLGSSGAQFQVGDMYLRGQGVEQDLLEAARWYTRAAEQGHPVAQYSLGILYKLGGGVRKSSARSVKWLARSAAQGVPEAQYELGLSYASGAGNKKDFVAAYKWLSLARAAASDGRTRTRAAQAAANVERMMTSEQIAAAREQIRVWQPTRERGAGS
jgi:TPR repeat protein